jgi:hypothetical protein
MWSCDEGQRGGELHHGKAELQVTGKRSSGAGSTPAKGQHEKTAKGRPRAGAGRCAARG